MFKQYFFILFAAFAQIILAASPNTSGSINGDTANYTISYDPGAIEDSATLSLRGRLYTNSDVEFSDVKFTSSLTEDSINTGGTGVTGTWKVTQPEDLVGIYIFAKTSDGSDFPEGVDFSVIGGYVLDNGTQSTFSQSITA